MSDELMIKKEGLVSLIESKDLGDVIKPLVREIHLFDSYVAGTTHIPDRSVLTTIKSGDSLLLMREDNKFDSNAIIILTEDKRKIGYVPEKDNIIFARLMDAGKFLKAKVHEVKERGTFVQVKVGIYLVDF